MFIGHFAVGFAAKRFAPRSSFLLLGWEQVRIDPGNTRFTPFDLVSYPWSHSLSMLCVWATAFGGRLLGLWNLIAGTMAVEFLMFAVGVWMYVSATRAKDRIGRYAFIAYIVLLMVFYIGDRFSTPPGTVGEIAWPGIAAPIILIPWAWWFDRHRSTQEELS